MKLEEEIRETCRTERERAFASQAEARDSYHRQYPEGRSESKKKSWFSVVNCPTQFICTWIFISFVFYDKTKRTQQGNLLTQQKSASRLTELVKLTCYLTQVAEDNGDTVSRAKVLIMQVGSTYVRI